MDAVSDLHALVHVRFQQRIHVGPKCMKERVLSHRLFQSGSVSSPKPVSKVLTHGYLRSCFITALPAIEWVYPLRMPLLFALER